MYQNRTYRKCLNIILAAILVTAGLASLLTAAGISGSCIAHAAEGGGTWVATSTPSYKHPVTGAIEDSGDNESIGQGMTESVLYRKALIEKNASGEYYATMRIYMLDNISDISFAVQSRGDSGWNSVTAEKTQENKGGDYCADYRIKIPDQNAIVRLSVNVTARGREVVFFASFSDLKEGHGNFVAEMASSGSSGDDVEGLTTSLDNEKDSSAKTSDKAESLPAISWVLVLQCILIILVPSLVIGGGLMAVIVWLRNREEIE